VAVGYVGTSRAIVALNKDSISETGRRAGRPSSTSYKNQNRDDKSDHHDGPEDSGRRQKRRPHPLLACHETVNLLLRSGPSCAAALSAVVAAAYFFIRFGMRCPLYKVRRKRLFGVVILGDIFLLVVVVVIPSFSPEIGGNEEKTAAAFAAASLPSAEA
jgi:hypothetical protein